jgi:hypothetical protein
MTKTKAFWQSAEQHTDKYKDAEDRPERVGARKDDGMKAGTARPIGVGKSPRKSNGRREDRVSVSSPSWTSPRWPSKATQPETNTMPGLADLPDSPSRQHPPPGSPMQYRNFEAFGDPPLRLLIVD